MTYYSIVIMKDGQIHMKPFNSRNEAEIMSNKILSSEKYGSLVESTKVVKRKDIVIIRKNHNAVIKLDFKEWI